jgi:hypothetical protein
MPYREGDFEEGRRQQRKQAGKTRKRFSLKKMLGSKRKKSRQEEATKKAATRLKNDLARDRVRLERAKRAKRNGRN